MNDNPLGVAVNTLPPTFPATPTERPPRGTSSDEGSDLSLLGNNQDKLS